MNFKESLNRRGRCRIEKLQRPPFSMQGTTNPATFQQKHDPEWKNRSGHSRIILDAFF